MVNHRALTASMIDSREFLAARRRADTELLAPAGTRIAFTGGTDCNDHTRIWDALDKVRAKHPDMVLLHGGSPRGAERIAACWADQRKVAQVVFKPDWTREGRNAAPFKRNDRMLEALPIGVVVFPGLRHLRQPRRQGQEARHPGVAVHRGAGRRRRRLGAVFSRRSNPSEIAIGSRQRAPGGLALAPMPLSACLSLSQFVAEEPRLPYRIAICQIVSAISQDPRWFNHWMKLAISRAAT